MRQLPVRPRSVAVHRHQHSPPSPPPRYSSTPGSYSSSVSYSARWLESYHQAHRAVHTDSEPLARQVSTTPLSCRSHLGQFLNCPSTYDTPAFSPPQIHGANPQSDTCSTEITPKLQKTNDPTNDTKCLSSITAVACGMWMEVS